MRASALPQRTVERVHTVTDGFGSRVDEHIPVAEAPADRDAGQRRVLRGLQVDLGVADVDGAQPLRSQLMDDGEDRIRRGLFPHAVLRPGGGGEQTREILRRERLHGVVRLVRYQRADHALRLQLLQQLLLFVMLGVTHVMLLKVLVSEGIGGMSEDRLLAPQTQRGVVHGGEDDIAEVELELVAGEDVIERVG